MNRVYRLKNVIYFPHLNVIGGVETYCYEMGLKYGKNCDLTVLYMAGDPQQVEKIGSVMRIIRIDRSDKIECDTFIFGWDSSILDNVTAKEYIQTFHADYVNRQLNPSMSPKITHRLGVSDNTTKGLREHFEWAANTETMYNPYTVKKPKRVLNLISATRLTPEKGFDRMKVLCKAFDDAGIPFIWLVFTDSTVQSPHPHMIMMPPDVNGILDYVSNADYLVQLSNTEGFSYSIVEALSIGKPCITTDFLVAREQGLVNGKTGYILPMDMSEIPIKDIYEKIPTFTPIKPRETHYEQFFSKGKSTYEKELKQTVTLRAKMRFFDIELQVIHLEGDQWQATRKRGYHLEALNLAEIVEDGQATTV